VSGCSVFAQETLLSDLVAHEPHVRQWLDDNYAKAYGSALGSTGGGESSSPTTKLPVRPESSGSVASAPAPRVPRVTVPRPKPIPEPQKIELAAHANPIPETIHKMPLDAIQKQKEERLQRIRDEVRVLAACWLADHVLQCGLRGVPPQTRSKYVETDAFKLHETRSNIDKIRAEVEAAREAEYQFKFKPRPVRRKGLRCAEGWFRRGLGGVAQAPKHTDKGEVKLNIAAVLREDSLFRKKQEQEAALIKAYESELRDTTEFDRWQAEMKQQDEEARLAAVEARRREMAASQLEAKEARFVAGCARIATRAFRGLLTVLCRAAVSAVGSRIVKLQSPCERKRN
jgi:hypothetical protein